MTEHFPSDPGLDPTIADPSAMHPELLEQQTAIREMVETCVKDEPEEDWMADILAKKYGLETGKYDAYINPVNLGDGSFAKFVNKEDLSDVLPGVTWLSHGGEASNLNTNVTSVVVHRSGDITGALITTNRTTKEQRREISESVTPVTDPDQADSYVYLLRNAHIHAQAMAKRFEGLRSGAAEADQQRKGAFGRMLGRFVTRGR